MLTDKHLDTNTDIYITTHTLASTHKYKQSFQYYLCVLYVKICAQIYLKISITAFKKYTYF
uniref:Uncharacterized protein n=1 Tax=Octopus bimaculoides TaxID=37653 RepID=A0A0L8GKG6_OCTBM